MDKLDVESICRLCCVKKSRMRSLFEQRKEYPLSLQQIISDVSRLQVDPEDRMPQKICQWCITTLLKIHATIETYRANDLKLREQLGSTMLIVQIKQEEEEVDMGLLEKALTHDLEVNDILIKDEATLEENLDSEVHGESEVAEKMDESFQDIEMLEEPFLDNEDDEWKPPEKDAQEDDDPPERKAYRRVKRKQKASKGKLKRGRPAKIDPNGEPKRVRRAKKDPNGEPRRGRRGKNDPNRPRLHDKKCYICKSEPLESAEALIAHLNSTHMDLLPYTCPECVMDTVVIKTVQRLNVHKRQHLNPEKCAYCDKRYADKSNVAFHVELHHRNQSNCSSTCEHCGKVFPTKGSLLYHMKIHTTAVSCEICGKVFKERQKLRLHIQRHHEKLKKHECNICKKKLGSLDAIRTHIKTYHSNQQFKCSYCPRIFTAELTHRSHEQKHLDNPDFVASKDWSQYYTIVEGEENKPGARLKKCNLCGLICTTMSVHLPMVHFPTEYRCTICDATFKRKNSLDNHVARHDNSNTCHCPICNRELPDRKGLIAHLRTKQHRDHPLAQSLEWLGVNSARTKPRKPKGTNVDTEKQADNETEEIGMDDSL